MLANSLKQTTFIKCELIPSCCGILTFQLVYTCVSAISLHLKWCNTQRRDDTVKKHFFFFLLPDFFYCKTIATLYIPSLYPMSAFGW